MSARCGSVAARGLIFCVVGAHLAQHLRCRRRAALVDVQGRVVCLSANRSLAAFAFGHGSRGCCLAGPTVYRGALLGNRTATLDLTRDAGANSEGKLSPVLCEN